MKILDGLDQANNLAFLREPEVIDYALKWRETFEIFSLNEENLLQVLKSSIHQVDEDERLKGSMSQSIKFRLDGAMAKQFRSLPPGKDDTDTRSSIRDQFELGGAPYYLIARYHSAMLVYLLVSQTSRFSRRDEKELPIAG